MKRDKIEISCVCCGKTKLVSWGSSTGKHAEESGFYPFMNVQHGLTVTWVCPENIDKVKQASNILRKVFGDELSYIHMTYIERLSRKDNNND